MENYSELYKIDLHIHSTISDGTDTPEELLSKVKAAGIGLFSLTDHDAIAGAEMVKKKRGPDDPLFISGAEFSCRDVFGKYHILGYGYDSSASAICSLVEKGHLMRLNKIRERLAYIKEHFGFKFASDDISELLSNNNPGKPHLANLMVKYGYAENKEDAFSRFLNRIKIPSKYIRPEEAITSILSSGGIPVLAHPSFGSGEEYIFGEEMDQRIQRLMDYGLKGLEAYYSGFLPRLQNEILGFAEKYDLYVTAGSDYHGKNKNIYIGENNLDDIRDAAKGVHDFLDAVELR